MFVLKRKVLNFEEKYCSQYIIVFCSEYLKYYDKQVFTNDIIIVWLAICCPIFLYSWMFTHFSLIVQMCLYVHGLVPQLIMGLLLKIKNTNNSCRHPFSTMQKHYRILYLYRPTTLRSLIWHVITIHCNPIFSFRRKRL